MSKPYLLNIIRLLTANTNTRSMSFEANIEIAGIHFVVTCRNAVLVQNIPDAYKPFYRNEFPDAQLFNVTVCTGPGKLPQTDKTKKIFDSEQSWSMFKDEDQYYISLDPSAIFKKISCHAQFDISIAEATLYSEILDSSVNDRARVHNPFCYPLDQILLMYILSKRDGALIHAAGINLKGKGYIFPGRSRAGKSTLSRQFAGAKNTLILSDDRVIVRKISNSFRVFGTPWPGEEGIAVNESAPLSGIFFISHGTENMAKDLKPVEALKRLMPVTSIPWFDRDVMPQILNFCEELVSNIPAYQLYFKPDTEVSDFLDKFNAS
jgi:hypothetical protein